MRQIKSFLILSLVSSLLLTVLFFWGGLDGAGGLGGVWKNLLQASALPPFNRSVLFLGAITLDVAFVWIALNSERARETFLICFAACLLVLGASLVAVLYGSFLNPFSGIAAILLGVSAIFVFTIYWRASQVIKIPRREQSFVVISSPIDLHPLLSSSQRSW